MGSSPHITYAAAPAAIPLLPAIVSIFLRYAADFFESLPLAVFCQSHHADDKQDSKEKFVQYWKKRGGRQQLVAECAPARHTYCRYAKHCETDTVWAIPGAGEGSGLAKLLNY
jgi:hypothetical protein